jgi:hypothetical protein
MVHGSFQIDLKRIACTIIHPLGRQKAQIRGLHLQHGLSIPDAIAQALGEAMDGS